MVCIDIGGDIGAEGLEENNEWLKKKIRNKKESTYSSTNGTWTCRTHYAPWDSPTPKLDG